MAAPSDITITNLSGKYVLNKTLSDPIEATLVLQGISWLVRKAIGLATVVLTIKQYKDDNSVYHIDIISVASGLSTTQELRTLDWQDRPHNDKIFGKLEGRSGLFKEFEKKGPASDEELPGGQSPAPSEKLYSLTVRLIGIEDSPLEGEWECFLGQTRLVDGKNKLVEIASGQSGDLSEPGIIRFVFPRTRGRSGTVYELRVKGFISDGFETPVKPAWMEQRLVVKIDDKLLESNGSVTATVRARHKTITTSKSTGAELSKEINDGWKLSGEVEGSIGLEVDPTDLLGPGGKLLTFLSKFAKGIAKVTGELSRKVSGEKSHSETAKKLDSIQDTQTWEIDYYTGTFDQIVEVV